MGMSDRPGLYQFAAFCLDIPERRLTLHGQPVPLPDKSFEVLHLLVQNAGKLVGKDELLGKLWPDAFVEESNLAKHISILRKALEDGARGKDYIETVPKRGYRFLVPVAALQSSPKPPVEASNGHSSFAPAPSLAGPPPVPATELSHPASVASPSVPRGRFLAIAVVVGCLAVLAVAAYMWKRPSPSNAYGDYQLLGMLTDSGRIKDLAISPDGNYVAYFQQERDGVALRLRHVLTRSDIEILPPKYVAFGGVTFSNDNAYLYFVRGDIESSVKSLYRLPVLGGAAQNLRDGVDSPIAFSPDGKQIAFEQHGLAEGMDLKIAGLDGSFERLVAHFADVVPQLVFYGPAWSQDGRTVAVSFKRSTSPERWILATVSLADGHVQELFSDANALGRPSWWANGAGLVIPRNDANDHGQLWTISYPRGISHQLIQDLGDYSYALSISQDARTLAAMALTGVVSNLWIANPRGLDKDRQLSSGLPLYLALRAPDGTPLALSDNGQLWVIGANGSRHPILSEFPMKAHLARCGTRIALSSYKEGRTTVLIANADGSEPHELMTGRLRSPECSPDGKQVYYVDSTKPQRIIRQSVDGGPETEVATVLGDTLAGNLSISPDGKLLAYAFRQHSDPKTLAWYLAVIPTTGRGPVVRIKVPQIAIGPKWSADGRSLEFLLVRDGWMNLWRQSLQGGGLEPITHFENGTITDFDWLADGKHLLLARGSANYDVVLWTKR